MADARKVNKYSKAQRMKMNENSSYDNSAVAGVNRVQPSPEDIPSAAPERNFVLITCDNLHCDQYNKFKVLELPRLKTSTAKVEL